MISFETEKLVYSKDTNDQLIAHFSEKESIRMNAVNDSVNGTVPNENNDNVSSYENSYDQQELNEVAQKLIDHFLNLGEETTDMFFDIYTFDSQAELYSFVKVNHQILAGSILETKDGQVTFLAMNGEQLTLLCEEIFKAIPAPSRTKIKNDLKYALDLGQVERLLTDAVFNSYLQLAYDSYLNVRSKSSSFDKEDSAAPFGLFWADEMIIDGLVNVGGSVFEKDMKHIFKAFTTGLKYSDFSDLSIILSKLGVDYTSPIAEQPCSTLENIEFREYIFAQPVPLDANKEECRGSYLTDLDIDTSLYKVVLLPQKAPFIVTPTHIAASQGKNEYEVNLDVITSAGEKEQIMDLVTNDKGEMLSFITVKTKDSAIEASKLCTVTVQEYDINDYLLNNNKYKEINIIALDDSRGLNERYAFSLDLDRARRQPGTAFQGQIINPETGQVEEVVFIITQIIPNDYLKVFERAENREFIEYVLKEGKNEEVIHYHNSALFLKRRILQLLNGSRGDVSRVGVYVNNDIPGLVMNSFLDAL